MYTVCVHVHVQYMQTHGRPCLPPEKKDGSPEPAGLPGGGGVTAQDGGEGEGLSMPILVEQQLQSQKLNILSEKNLTEALTQFVEKEDTDAISE